MCLVQFEFVELYNGLGWKKKYHAPTDFGFALKVTWHEIECLILIFTTTMFPALT